MANAGPMANVRLMMQYRNDFLRAPALRPLVMALLAGALLWLQAGIARAAAEGTSAVVFMYHRFAESDYPSTSVTLGQFEAHLRELREGGYTVLPLTRIIADLKAGRPLPDRTVAITIDDAFRSIYEVAWPRFREAGLPFTIFVSTDPVDRGLDDYMTWEQLRELRDAGVDLQPHSLSHDHLAAMPLDQSTREITGSRDRLEEMLGIRTTLFAYPYGDYGDRAAAVVAAAGYLFGIATVSGPLHCADDFYRIRRINMMPKDQGLKFWKKTSGWYLRYCRWKGKDF